jgi:sugar/nucleoside kinase (ribokinase family)
VVFDGSTVLLDGARVLHVGYPALLQQFYEDDGRRLRHLFERARATGVTTSLDLSTPDPDGPAGAVDWVRWIESVAPVTDVLMPSCDDLSSSLRRPHDTLEALDVTAGWLLTAGVAVVCIKAGYRGALLRTGSADRLRQAGSALDSVVDLWARRHRWQNAYDVRPIDTTGAGDAGCAGLLAGLLSGSDAPTALTTCVLAGTHRVLSRRSLPRLDDLATGMPDPPAVDGPGWFPATPGQFRGPHEGVR